MKALLILLFAFCFARIVSAEDNPHEVRFLYIRHGEVPGNVSHVYTGCGTDESLTEKGKIQAAECAKRISNLQKSGRFGKMTAIYASDLKRALETAEPIAKELGLAVHIRHDLREIYWGCADGERVQKMDEQYAQREEEIEQLYPERKLRWDYLPVFEGAETYNALLKRTHQELEEIAERHRGEMVLIVGHGRVLKTIIMEALGAEEKIPRLPNCAIVEFIYSPTEGLRFVEAIVSSLSQTLKGNSRFNEEIEVVHRFLQPNFVQPSSQEN